MILVWSEHKRLQKELIAGILISRIFSTKYVNFDRAAATLSDVRELQPDVILTCVPTSKDCISVCNQLIEGGGKSIFFSRSIN